MTRIIAAAVEVFHDEKGIIWPQNLSPYDMHLIVLGSDKEVQEKAEQIYEDLWDSGNRSAVRRSRHICRCKVC